jgi:hypothetical protein
VSVSDERSGWLGENGPYSQVKAPVVVDPAAKYEGKTVEELVAELVKRDKGPFSQTIVFSYSLVPPHGVVQQYECSRVH